MKRFSCGTRVVSGEGALSVLAEQKSRRMLLVTEPGEWRSPVAGRIIQAAGNPKTEYLDGASREPTMKQAVEGSRKIREFRPELVVALGDSGVLDYGKAAVCFSGHPCVLAAIPTAIGAGTEVTERVLLRHNGSCHLLRNGEMRPGYAILDSSLPRNPARGEIAEEGFALMAAALEAFTAPDSGMLTAIHAREAFSIGWAALPAACAGNEAAFRRLQMGSVLTGLAVGHTGLGLCQAMTNALSTVFGLPRGKLAGILLPAVIGCNAHAAGRKYAELSRAAGLGGSREEIGLRNLKTGLIRLRRELGLPGTLLQAGVDLRSAWGSGKRIVELTLEDPECRNNPVTADDFLIRRILEEITGKL